LLACSIGMAVLGTVQHLASPTSVLNRYAWDGGGAVKMPIAVAGGYVRATGTFSYIAGLTAFSMIMFCLFLGRSLSARRGRARWLAIVGLGSAVVCGSVTGSRAVLVFVAVVTAGTLVFIPKRNMARLTYGLIGAGAVLGLIMASPVSEGILSRWCSTSAQEAEGRITGSATGQPILETLGANPVGWGLGLYTGVSAYSGSEAAAELPYNESIWNRVAAEAGLAGLLALLLGAGLIVQTGRWTLAVADPARKTRLLPLAIGALIQVAIGLWYDHTSTGLWWWAISIWWGDGVVERQRVRIVLGPEQRVIVAARLRA